MIKKASMLSKVSAVFICGLLAKLASLFKVSFIAGSYMALFSGTNSIAPLSGLFGGIGGATGLFSINILVRILTHGSLSLKSLAYHIPGFFASGYWVFPSFLVRAAVPAACMLLFLMHPVGFAAAPYALYWLVPIALFFVPRKNMFLHSVATTFIGHAVGSVIWLYTVEMSSAMWLALIPVVAIERLLFAVGMTGAYHAISWLSSIVSLFIYKKISPVLLVENK